MAAHVKPAILIPSWGLSSICHLVPSSEVNRIQTYRLFDANDTDPVGGYREGTKIGCRAV